MEGLFRKAEGKELARNESQQCFYVYKDEMLRKKRKPQKRGRKKRSGRERENDSGD